ncbi:MAG: EAL domain-containing protein [Gallionellaceae bacterium]|nr:EAL domain-containing protein [Gallionellaceae bacterium]
MELRLAEVIFEHSSEVLMITDAKAHIISVNTAFTHTSGYTASEVLGKNPRLLSSGEHNAAFYRTMWGAIHSNGFWAGEIWDKHKDGHLYPKWLKIIAVKDSEGKATHYVSIATDISVRKANEENIDLLAHYDALTGLPNRTLLHERIKQLISAAQRDKRKFALLFIDLDRFKYVNDSMGHAVGDRLLQAVALSLRNSVRECDTVSRIGGDEFGILLREADIKEAAHVSQLLLDRLLNQPYEIDDIRLTVQASIGISIYPDNGLDIDTLSKHADVAMYRAKEEGRNCFRFFTAEMNARINHLFSMEKDLRLALERSEFYLFFQPQMDLVSNKLCGAEALIRWKHPTKGLISPVEFIPVAEETGQIIAIGEWVLRTACEKIAAWRQQATLPFSVAVNLSIHQFRQPNFAQLIAAVIQEHAIQPGELELEVTESIMLSDTQVALDFISAMREMGLKLSIDDFGTGYSSLSYLKKMPVHKLKIDRSFVREINIDPNDEAIVRSIIGLAHQFNLQVIAEGVETQEQQDFLRELGCNEIQGFFYGKPLPEQEFLSFVQAESQAFNGTKNDDH